MLSREINELAQSHPCYSESAHNRIARLHLPVAEKCNIACRFCDKKVSPFYHTSRPGLAYYLLEPEDVIETVENALNNNPNLRVIGISGPGEPLFNANTFKTLQIVSENFPFMRLCICTNGLLLPEKSRELKGLNVSSLTVTINAIDPFLASKISSYSMVDGKKIQGEEGAYELIMRQLEGLNAASQLGFLIKVNTVLIPRINGNHIKEIAYEVKKRGAHILNIMPLIPIGNFSNERAPSCDELIVARETAECVIPIFRACKQCRADACGIPGKEIKYPKSSEI